MPLIFRQDPEGNEWRIVFNLIKSIDYATALDEWRCRSAGTHIAGFKLYSSEDHLASFIVSKKRSIWSQHAKLRCADRYKAGVISGLTYGSTVS